MARHKVCLVARGFTQVEGINFNERFSHVVWMESIWVVLIVVVVTEDLKVHQMDVKNAFWNGGLSKKIYM
jgi:hypothetical protein